MIKLSFTDKVSNKIKDDPACVKWIVDCEDIINSGVVEEFDERNLIELVDRMYPTKKKRQETLVFDENCNFVNYCKDNIKSFSPVGIRHY